MTSHGQLQTIKRQLNPAPDEDDDPIRATLGALAGAQRPLTPKEVSEDASDQAAEFNLTTVSRDFKSMTEGGEITAVEVFGRPPRDELAGLDHQHQFLCVVCTRAMTPDDFEVKGRSILLTGHCATCR